MMHDLELQLDDSGEDRLYRGTCSCGWLGPWTDWRPTATSDCANHLGGDGG